MSEPLAVLLAVAALYPAYALGARAKSWRRRGLGPVASVVAQRCSGAILLGAAPVALAAVLGTLGECGLFPHAPAGWFAALVVVAVLPVVWQASRRPDAWVHHPELRVERWTPGLLVLDLALWGLYLLGYEALFRGVFLFSMVRWLGPVGGIGLVAVVYAVVHLDKGRGEVLGSAVMGGIFGAVALQAGSFWGVFAAHWVIAATNTLGVLRHNPELSWSGGGGRRSGPGTPPATGPATG